MGSGGGLEETLFMSSSYTSCSISSESMSLPYRLTTWPCLSTRNLLQSAEKEVVSGSASVFQRFAKPMQCLTPTVLSLKQQSKRFSLPQIPFLKADLQCN